MRKEELGAGAEGKCRQERPSPLLLFPVGCAQLAAPCAGSAKGHVGKVWGPVGPQLAPAALPASLPGSVAQSHPPLPLPGRIKPQGDGLRNTDKHSLY